MCGIVGVIDFRFSADADALGAAAATLHTRGPDDSGMWTFENVGLSHQRLAILDPTSSGHQPMLSTDRRFVIVFNGEIYNFLELRQQLHKDAASWESKSDTEVILAAYAKWGTQCVCRFHGMFAFAIWDRREKALFAARDRMGSKPFYYHYSPACFAFASRPRALLTLHPDLSSELDEQALRLYLESGYVPAPYSIFKSIRKLPPAHWLLLNDHGLQIDRYWDFRQITPEPSWNDRHEEDLCDELDEILSRSVQSRMVSDVPLGAFLSGGIDSSLVVAVMAKHSSRPVKTFTIGFEEQEFDESKHAQAVARYLGTEHHCERLKLDDLLLLMATFREEFDEPFFDFSAFPTMAASRMARRYVTVSLSGDGGDELFGGYHYYQIARRLGPLYRSPAVFRRWLAALASAIPQHRFQLLSAALRHDTEIGAFCFARSISKDFDGALTADTVARTQSLLDLFTDAAKHFPVGLDASESGMRLDAFYTLPDDYLQKVDLASMAFSLESRDPLLDQDLVEWAMKLPLKWKLRGTQNKYLLRKLAYRYIPQEMVDRPKQGFEVPIGEWLRGPLRTWAISRLSDAERFKGTPLSQSQIMQLFRLHISGKRNVHALLWAVLVFLDFASGLRGRESSIAAAVSNHGN
jgi:asparagine synthase (glutamine-hydrolysing)